MNDTLERFAREVPDTVDRDHLINQWRALPARYPVEGWRLPLPPWPQRPFDHDGPTAWTKLGRDLQLTGLAGPFCLYAHTSFCFSKCGSCDSYSFVLATHKPTHFRWHVDALCRESDLWSTRGSLATRPVSTVHLGGGTPTLPPRRELIRLPTHIRSRFAVTASTEWAVEPTVEGFTPDIRHVLHDLGFHRLHIGVQSMEDLVRSGIGQSPTGSSEPTSTAMDVTRTTGGRTATDPPTWRVVYVAHNLKNLLVPGRPRFCPGGFRLTSASGHLEPTSEFRGPQVICMESGPAKPREPRNPGTDRLGIMVRRNARLGNREGNASRPRHGTEQQLEGLDTDSQERALAGLRSIPPAVAALPPWVHPPTRPTVVGKKTPPPEDRRRLKK